MLVFHLFTYIFRYRVAIPVDYISKQLSLDADNGTGDWTRLTAELGLTYADPAKKTLLDCKASMAALPLTAKPASS